jgi:hypothetical protein
VNIALHVTLVDGAVKEYRVAPSDVLDFEEEFNVSAEVLADSDRRRMSHIMFLGYSAARRVGDTDLEFRDWVNTVDEFGSPEGDDPGPLES